MTHLQELAVLRERLKGRKKQAEALQTGVAQSVDVGSPNRLDIDQKSKSDDATQQETTLKHEKEEEKRAAVPAPPPPKQSLEPKDTLTVRPPPRDRKLRLLQPPPHLEVKSNEPVNQQSEYKKDTQVRVSPAVALKRKRGNQPDTQLNKPADSRNPFQTLVAKPIVSPQTLLQSNAKASEPAQINPASEPKQHSAENGSLLVPQVNSSQTHQSAITISPTPNPQSTPAYASEHGPTQSDVQLGIIPLPASHTIQEGLVSPQHPVLAEHQEGQIGEIFDTYDKPAQEAASLQLQVPELSHDSQIHPSEIERERKKTLESLHSVDIQPEVAQPILKKDRILQKIYFKEAEQIRAAERNLQYALFVFEKVADLKRHNKLPPLIHEKLKLLRDIIRI